MKPLTRNEMEQIQGGMTLRCAAFLASAGIVTSIAILATGGFAGLVVGAAVGGFLLEKSPCE